MAAGLRDFRFIVGDRRYSVPTLLFVEASDEARAKLLAAMVLNESKHHTSVEVWEGDALLFTLGEDHPSSDVA